MIPSSAWVTNEYDLTLRLIVTILRVKMAILWGKIIILRGENEAYRSKWVLIMQFGFGTYFDLYAKIFVFYCKIPYLSLLTSPITLLFPSALTTYTPGESSASHLPRNGVARWRSMPSVV